MSNDVLQSRQNLLKSIHFFKSHFTIHKNGHLFFLFFTSQQSLSDEHTASSQISQNRTENFDSCWAFGWLLYTVDEASIAACFCTALFSRASNSALHQLRFTIIVVGDFTRPF
jgi:hypothetical protein